MFGPLLSVLAVILGLVLVGPISPAGATGNGNSDDCVPSDAVPASFSDWTASDSYTAYQTGNTAPDPDGQSGDDNPLNLKRAGAIDQKTVDNGDGYTLYYTGSGDGSQNESDAAWTKDTPLAGWTQIDERTVTDKAETNQQVVDHYQNYSFNPHGDFVTVDALGPQWPDDAHWNANNGDHNGHPQPGDPEVNSRGNYFMSSGNSGRGDWFHWEAIYKTVHTDAVTHEEYKYSKTVPSGSHTEYRWVIETRSYTPAKDAVTCDHNPGGNNGTIKVDDDGLPGCKVGHGDDGKCDNGVGNDPHLGCQFYVEWYNYEANATSTVSFEVQDPTDGTVTAVQGRVAPDTVTLDGDGPESGSDQGFDGAELYQLSFTDAPQENHGWHVKVTTHTTSSNGADTKFKTFWVEGDCQVIPETPTVTMDDQCGTANDSGPTYTAENDYWTTTEGADSVVFHAKDGFYFPAGDNTSEDGKTYTVSYTPNTDESCGDASAGVNFTDPTCDTGATATPGAVTNATWDEDYSTVTGPGSYSFVAHAVAGYHFPAGPNVNPDGTMKTFSGELPGSLSDTQDCTVQPGPTQRSEHMSEQSCDLGGVHTWDDVYTTTYAWDEASGTYVGTETGPVAENDQLTPFTAQQAEDLGCVEVEGEQTHGHHGGGTKHHPEVKGEQAHAPAAAVVPTQVEAGLAGTPAGAPVGGSSNLPLWALSLGAGMFLVGAGRLRRTSRTTR